MLGQIIDDVVEIVGRPLRSACNHVADQVAPFFPRLGHPNDALGAVACAADPLHCFAARSGRQSFLGLAGEEK